VHLDVEAGVISGSIVPAEGLALIKRQMTRIRVEVSGTLASMAVDRFCR